MSEIKFTYGDAAELFRKHGNATIRFEDANTFMEVLRKKKIKFDILQSETPDKIKFIKR